MPETTHAKDRPLSPHLQIYRLPLTARMSILHRITGAGLILGLMLFTWWLVAAASGPDAYEDVQNFMGSSFGTLVLFGFSAALYYHLLNGIRHLFWDMGYLFKIESAYKAGYAVLAGAIILTAATWICAMNYAGKHVYSAEENALELLVEDGGVVIIDDNAGAQGQKE
ncbi:MAG: succinate dehydrogenase, cytochrome b556 subunit [Alphaproteobacteria bacterium]|nr:succinate dehydrogenase, cytochrome b556 subunit [Alphaproteobacteria bacterium]